ncbi:hypothetical protein RRG08_046589 [Elysia crispata]|uniref:Uncharacterized protein n=1 Tax=Elysia crispata TaxID=231223 RepID=A0AAE1AP53_9GAST|nr:hypothetical protein RRG08_046589 [Elysia crispata]
MTDRDPLSSSGWYRNTGHKSVTDSVATREHQRSNVVNGDQRTPETQCRQVGGTETLAIRASLTQWRSENTRDPMSSSGWYRNIGHKSVTDSVAIREHQRPNVVKWVVQKHWP